MRPGELMALDWSDVNLPALRLTVSKRLYRGTIDLPKSNKVRVIALTPPARGCAPVSARAGGARCSCPREAERLRRRCPTTGRGPGAAGLRFDFYLATKHKCVHYMKVELNLPNHDIAAQMGWSENPSRTMVATYAHAE